MQVIGHEAVRNCFHSALICRTQEFISDRIDTSMRGEVLTTPEGVHREEDADGTDVLRFGETGRASVIHASGRSKIRAARDDRSAEARVPFDESLG